VAGRHYNFCSACSDNIIDAYRKDGWDFVQKALADKEYVEELSGLKEVCAIDFSFDTGADKATGPANSRSGDR
jgi:hypothetical protein